MGAKAGIAVDPRGIVRRQDQLAADIRIIALPEGRDPDELIRSQPDLWSQLVEDAPPYLDWLIAQARAAHDLDSPRGRSEFAAELTPIAQAIGDHILREHYVRQIAALARVDPEGLPRGGRRSASPRTARASQRRPAEPAAPAYAEPRPDRATGPQRLILQLALTLPAACETLPDDASELMDDSEDRVILETRLADSQSSPSDDDWIRALPDGARERAQTLIASARTLPPYTISEVREAVRQAVERIRSQRARQLLRMHEQELTDLERQHDRAAIARAAAALDRDRDGDIDPALREPANAVRSARDAALHLHHSSPRRSQS